MSSLKDIMDVDVEPLESQAYRRSREAAQHQASRPSIIQTAETPSPPVEDDEDHSINKGKAPVRRRRSNRVSKSTTISTLPQIEDQQRRDSAVGDVMDFQSGYQGAGASQASSSGMSQQMSRAPDAGAEMPVKYTPVTGRISRAKKGVPVHTCDICRPAKTFTRAEHLRRHQLSHQKPLHACTFEDCERAFHRPDLLARHMHRHETQGEKAYKASDPRSRASSSASESLPSLKTETLVPGSSGMGGLQASPTDSSTPRTTSGESAMTASSSNTITQNFPPINSAGTRNHKRSASVAQLSEGMSYPPPSPGASRTPVSYSQMTSDFSTRTSDFLFAEGGDPSFAGNYTTTPQLPLLRIPEDPFPPALSYAQDNSPWCSSSASDSTFSNHSDGSRSARQWSQRGRSASIADWPISATSPWTSHGLSTTPQDMRGSPFDAVLDQYEQTTFASPRVSPPNASQSQLLDVPGYGSYYMESVGTPTLSTYTKPISQVFPASPSRVSNAGLASIDATRAKEQLALHAIPTTTSEYLPQPQLETYLDSYFEHFHPLFPIIHRPTFDPTDGSLLSTAVAAIGTQYHNTVEARQKGSELNESCRKNIAMCTSWSLPIMQAILLTELFTRFRGRKTQVTLSRQFENLYRRLFQYNEQNQTPTSTTTSPTTSASVDVLLARYGAQTDGTAQPLDLTSKWIHWFQTEARQRLLTACFIFDVHQSLYHQQPRSKVLGGILHPALSYPCAERLWNARTATEWQSLQSEHAYEQRPFNLLDLDLSQQPRLESPFSQTLLICSLTTQFPTRQEPIYSNHFNPRLLDSGLGNLTAHFPTNLLAQTYLALYHTPLLDLLAIAGDTWIFSQKVTPPAKYCDHLRRLKSWSTSPAAAQATIHSCHILSLRLSRPYKDSHQPDFLSDYWSLYVATLICWAFGHRYQISNNVSSGLNRGNSSTPARPAVVEDVTSLETADGARSKALQYVNSMLALNIDDLLTPKASMKGETSSVINAVRYCLELSSVGDKSSILVDCIGVLKKISKSGKGKWF